MRGCHGVRSREKREGDRVWDGEGRSFGGEGDRVGEKREGDRKQC
jgi:hypothetical protein